MQQAIIHIPKPCHQNWQQMTPTEKGKFCGSCQKEVIDFTSMTDAELLAFLANRSTNNICGRLHSSQLNIPISKPVVHKKKRFWHLQYIATLLLLLTRPGISAKAQTKPLTTVSPVRSVVSEMAPIQSPADTIQVLQGMVKDSEYGKPLADVSITIIGSRTGTVTRLDGSYRLNVRNLKANDIVVFSTAEYKTIKISVKKLRKKAGIVKLDRRSILLGDVVITSEASENR